MKKLIIAFAVMAACLSACTEELTESYRDSGEVRITAGFADTKTAFVEDGDVVHVNWVEGDQIGLYAGEHKNVGYAAKSSGSKTEFEKLVEGIEIADGETVYAYYPYNCNTDFANNSSIYVNNVFQDYKSDSSEKDLLIASAVADDNSVDLKFRHVFSFLKIDFSQETFRKLFPDGVIRIVSFDNIAYSGSMDIRNPSLSDDSYSISVDYAVPSDVTDPIITCYVAILPQKEGSVIYIINPMMVDENSSSWTDMYVVSTKTVPEGGFQAGCVYSLDFTDGNKDDAAYKRDREALMALYNATDGDNWVRNDNWGTDEHLSKWYGVEYNFGEGVHSVKMNYNNMTGVIPDEIGELAGVTELDFGSNSLSGTIPESLCKLNQLKILDLSGNRYSGEFPAFLGQLPNLRRFHIIANEYSGDIPESLVELMDIPDLAICGNRFTGKIPSAVSSHPRWPVLWPTILRHGEPNCNQPVIDTEGLFIPAPVFNTTDFDGNVVSSESEYANNKYTLFLEWSTFCSTSEMIVDELLPYYDSYREKGVDIIGWNDPEDYETLDELTQFIEKKGIPWRNLKHRYALYSNIYANPFICIADQQGQIIMESITTDFSTLIKSFNRMIGVEDKYLYESWNYDKDGWVTSLQSATRGNGIDIVIMGDAYSDRLIDNGTYERDMRKAMDFLFSEEPFKTFREYFNVYMVNVISKNEVYGLGGATTALDTYFGAGITLVGGNNDKVISQALKAIPEERIDEAMLIVLMNSSAYAGTCYFYEGPYENDYGSGVSISYFPIGVNDDQFEQILHHEALGHGFAKLADEYVNISSAVPASVVEAVTNDYMKFGRWKNIDFISDPSKVKWSRFLNDSRYDDDGLGVFEGGHTYAQGVWRPTEDSIMRYNVGGFNAPSREAIYYRIHKLAYGEDWEYDYEKFVEYDAINRNPATKSGRPNYVEKPKSYEHCPPVVYDSSWREVTNNNDNNKMR